MNLEKKIDTQEDSGYSVLRFKPALTENTRFYPGYSRLTSGYFGSGES